MSRNRGPIGLPVRGTFDVVVVGGGPGGCAVAGLLARQGLSVALFERGTYDTPRVGESIGPQVRTELQRLGALDFVQPALDSAVPFVEVRASWVSAMVGSRPSIWNPLGEGWHVDRAQFDRGLANWAQSMGAKLFGGRGVCAPKLNGMGVVLTTASGDCVEAGFAVDASGRGGSASAQLSSRRWLAMDRQVALMRSFPPSLGSSGQELVLESAPTGWWYVAPQPQGAKIAVFVTDADLIPRGSIVTRAKWFEAELSRVPLILDALAGHPRDLPPPSTWRAESGVLLPSAGSIWAAVGDAALARDPLAGDGVAMALKDARLLAEKLISGAFEPAAHALACIREFRQNLDARELHYDAVERWAAEPFWARRQPGPWREISVSLGPEARLQWVPGQARSPLHEAEALLTPFGVASLHQALTNPTPAHAALQHLKCLVPFDIRRLLAGFQSLLRSGHLKEV